MKAQVITPWGQLTVPGLGLTEQCKLKIDHPDIWTWVDVTAQPAENLSPNPNMYVVEITCDQITLDAIEADPNYHVLWSEES